MPKPKEILDQAKPSFHIHTTYDPPPSRARIDEGESLAHQSFKEECDINNIMAKHRESGVITHMAAHQGQYADFGDVGDFQMAMDRVVATTDMFMTLPAELRADFQNDPGLFMDYVLDPENEADMRERGLLPPIQNPKYEPQEGSGGAAGGSPEPAPSDPAADEPPAA